MGIHFRPCCCCSVTTGTRILAILLAVGSFLLALLGIFLVIERGKISCWLRNLSSAAQVAILGFEFTIAGVSGVVVAIVAYLGSSRANKYRKHSEENQLSQLRLSGCVVNC